MWANLRAEIEREMRECSQAQSVDGLEISIREYSKIVRAERERERREIMRCKSPPTVEQRLCSICGELFEVTLRLHPGRVKNYCCAECQRLDWWDAHGHVSGF